MELKCELCGDIFVGYKGQRFCTNKCKNEYLSRIYKAKSEFEYLKNPKNCKYCGKIISYKNRKNVFCSRSCATSYNNKLRIRVGWTEEQKNRVRKNEQEFLCKYCGKKIQKNASVCHECKLYVRRIKTFQKFGLNDGALKDRYEKLKSIIQQDYFENLYSLEMIAKSYEIDLSVVYKIINEEFGGCRSQSESILLAIKEGRIDLSNNTNHTEKYNFISGKHKSWDNKIYSYRSSWEDKYMTELDNQKISYIYEPFTIEYFDSKRNITRYAIPDFFFPDTNEIVELKSSYTLRNQIQEMKDKFESYKKLGYKPKLLLNGKFVNIQDINENNV